MVLITIRLVGAENDEKKIWENIPIDPQISVTDLKEKIKDCTKIPLDFQEIEFRGGPLADMPHPLDSVNDSEELVVKHSQLEVWVEYKNNVEEVLKHVEDVQEVVELHEHLENCGIFDVYEEFNDFQEKNHAEVASWIDPDVFMMRRTAKEYFRKIHDEKRGEEESEFICYFEERDHEYLTITRAFVQIHGEDSPKKFKLQPHYYGFNYMRQRWEPDVSELYRYKLLELIGVTPKAHIITNIESIDTETYVYIATQWDNRFQKLGNILDEESLTADLVVQIVMLKELLHMSVHEENCGKWERTENAAIVDFSIHEDFQVYTHMKYQILTSPIHRILGGVYRRIRNQYDDNAWLKIAKVHFDRWDMANKIDLAREQLGTDVLECLEIGFQKRPFNSKFEITPMCEDTPTEQLNEFIETLRENLENLRKVLNFVV
ncbi:hypothetical protein B9Z55_008643 [Caenorhabditis nigoni]|uniref:Ubiquitin-like domain-containing protein n=1 Tax=Caenorhabditis nigoni TaxID=1611254 RepID=A0A2G5UNG5_9PELO|nr:hypothetical protein B9Z55_008643 [Caenorhabditis nigoni]